MDNKSELSKPKAFVVTGGKMYQDRSFTDKSTAERSKADRHDGAVVEPLYSQEYVSALTQRIAELEEEFAFIMGQNDGMEKELREKDARIEHLEAKLATPVRLPDKNDDEFWFDNVFQVAKFDRAVERAISAAGFKFVGDDQP